MITPLCNGYFARFINYAWIVYHLDEPSKVLFNDDSLFGCREWAIKQTAKD